MLLLGFSSPAAAQRAAPAAVASTQGASLTAANRTAAIAAMNRVIQTKYVFPDRVPAIVMRL
jgi:hypothetical protein